MKSDDAMDRVEELIGRTVASTMQIQREVILLALRQPGVPISSNELITRATLGAVASVMGPDQFKSILGGLVSFGFAFEDDDGNILVKEEILREYEKEQETIAEYGREITGRRVDLNEIILLHDEPGKDYTAVTKAEVRRHLGVKEEIIEEPKAPAQLYSLEDLLKEFGGGEIGEA